jgi:monofunctional chorismate mutase
MNFSSWRNEIDRIDGEILNLLKRRAEIVAEIGHAKAQKRMPVVDKARERQILSRIETDFHSVLSAEAAHCVFRCIIKESRRIQSAIIEGTVELC